MPKKGLITALHTRLAARDLSCEELTKAYLDAIERDLSLIHI